jgi:hypothetical protein
VAQPTVASKIFAVAAAQIDLSAGDLFIPKPLELAIALAAADRERRKVHSQSSSSAPVHCQPEWT